MARGRGGWGLAGIVAGALLLVPLVGLYWLGAAERRADRTARSRDSGEGERALDGPAPVAGDGPRAGRPAGLGMPDEDTTDAETGAGGGAAVAGTVLDPDGQPVAGAFVACVAAEEPDAAGATSDAEGRFTLALVSPSCTAVASHPRFGDSEPAVVRADRANALWLTAGASIEGVVVDPAGRAVAEFTVAIESYRARPGDARERAQASSSRVGDVLGVNDSGGAFRFEGLRPGRYVLLASAPKHPPAASEGIDVEAAERVRGVRLVLGPGGSLEGLVRDGATGEPIAEATVTLDGLTMTAAYRPEPARADASGRYRLDGVPSERFSVRVSAPGYRGRVLPGLEVAPHGSRQLDVDLLPLGDGGAETEYAGIGAVLATSPAGVIVAALVEGGPAAKAGLVRRDLLVRIEGRDVEGWSLPMCVQQLRGPPGSRVAVTVARAGEGEVEAVVVREQFVR